MPIVIALDAGTTGVRALAVGGDGAVGDVAYRELTQHYPRPGRVEHDAAEIWRLTVECAAELAGRLDGPPAAIGITNQRETVVCWDRSTGAPLAPALVWQDRRTAQACGELAEAGLLPLVRERTGLVLDPYFSATKLAWLFEEGGVDAGASTCAGTVDSWVLWNLTGGPDGGVHATEPSNASRTLVYDIHAACWSTQLAEILHVPLHVMPEVRPSCGRFGVVAGALASAVPTLAGVPVSGIAGDQQAALFGQACFAPGQAKATYGTGTFVLMQLGPTCPEPMDGILTTVAWDLGGVAGGPPGPAYALEGSVFASGAAIQWLRDGLGVITEAAEVGPLAAQAPAGTRAGVHLVPAFAGLGSPTWDPFARGVLTGISRGVGRAEIARATVDAIAFQTADVVDAMTAGARAALVELRADGGAAVMDLLLQMQADQLGVPVLRPVSTETTAQGAAWLAGLAEGVWSSLEELSGLWREERRFSPAAPAATSSRALTSWHRALERSRRWASGQ